MLSQKNLTNEKSKEVSPSKYKVVIYSIFKFEKSKWPRLRFRVWLHGAGVAANDGAADQVPFLSSDLNF